MTKICHQWRWIAGGIFLLALVLQFSLARSSSATATGVQMKTNSLGKKTDHDTGVEPGNVVIRFYFIRHGQTQANLDGIVVGQLDSPLTELGVQQAKAAGRSKLLPRSYWRQYSSDLGRAQQTAQLILQGLGIDEEGSSNKIEILKMEKRLRERAKGVREGLSKKLSYKEATMLRQNEKDMESDPLYETEDNVWDRVQDWLYEVVGDAVRLYYATESQQEEKSGETVGVGSSRSSNSAAFVAQSVIDSDGGSTLQESATGVSSTTIATTPPPPPPPPPRVYTVFCLSHSGALRAVIRKLVGSQLPSSIDLTPAGKDGAKAGMLYLPNTSITVIDIMPQTLDPKQWEQTPDAIEVDPSQLWTAKLVELTRADHLDTLVETEEGAPESPRLQGDESDDS